MTGMPIMLWREHGCNAYAATDWFYYKCGDALDLNYDIHSTSWYSVEGKSGHECGFFEHFKKNPFGYTINFDPKATYECSVISDLTYDEVLKLDKDKISRGDIIQINFNHASDYIRVVFYCSIKSRSLSVINQGRIIVSDIPKKDTAYVRANLPEMKFLMYPTSINETIGVAMYTKGLSDATVMIVNPNTYKELFGEYEIPSRILYKVTEDAEDELTGLFSGRDYIELTDVKGRNGNNRQVKVIDKIYYLIAAMTFVFVVLNCIVIAYINVTNNKKEYAIMSALGISKSHITKMIAYQLCSVMIRSLVIADIISVIHTDIYLNSINSNSKVMYSMPYAEIIFCNIVILCSCAGVLFLFIRKFWNMVAKEKMRD